MNKRKFIILLIPILVISFAVLWKSYRSKPEEKIHYHAGFMVYVDGKREDFSDIKYMDIEPCNAPGHEIKEDDQLEKAHLHDNIGDVVHVHRDNAKWKDLFTNIAYKLPDDVQGYVDGAPVENIFNEPITPYESVLIVAGDSKGVDLTASVSADYIREIEKKSETCGT